MSSIFKKLDWGNEIEVGINSFPIEELNFHNETPNSGTSTKFLSSIDSDSLLISYSGIHSRVIAQSKKFNISLIQGLNCDEILEGETSCMNAKMKWQIFDIVYNGSFIVTNYRIVFCINNKILCKKEDINPDYFKVPFGLIAR